MSEEMEKQIEREEDFQKLWKSLMQNRMRGSYYLAKKFYLIGRSVQENLDKMDCVSCSDALLFS